MKILEQCDASVDEYLNCVEIISNSHARDTLYNDLREWIKSIPTKYQLQCARGYEQELTLRIARSESNDSLYEEYKKTIRRIELLEDPQKHKTSIDIEEVKKVPIIEVIKSYNIRVEQEYNHRAKCKCPFHNERTASLVIYTNTNSFYCFGCNTGGSNIDFVRLLDNISVGDAIKKLSKLI